MNFDSNMYMLFVFGGQENDVEGKEEMLSFPTINIKSSFSLYFKPWGFSLVENNVGGKGRKF